MVFFCKDDIEIRRIGIECFLFLLAGSYDVMFAIAIHTFTYTAFHEILKFGIKTAAAVQDGCLFKYICKCKILKNFEKCIFFCGFHQINFSIIIHLTQSLRVQLDM